jgi:hypothetical protein
LGCVAPATIGAGSPVGEDSSVSLDVGDPVRVDLTEQNQHHATVAALPDRFVFTWDAGRAYQDAIVVRAALDRTGAPLWPVAAPTQVQALARPDVFTDADALWTTWQSSDRYLLLAPLDSEGTASGPEVVVSEMDSAALQQTAPDGALLVDGDVVVIWVAQYEAAPHALYRWRRFDVAGMPRGPAQDLEESTAHHAPPDVAALPEGGFVAAWEVAEPTWRDVRLGRWGATGALESVVTVLPDAGTWDTRPMVAAAADGTVALVWYDQPPIDEPASGAHLAVFLPGDDAPFCDATVGTPDAGEQPVATWLDGVLWVAWQEATEDGTADVWLQAWRDCAPLDDTVQLDATGPHRFEERPAIDGHDGVLTVSFESHEPGEDGDARVWAVFATVAGR